MVPFGGPRTISYQCSIAAMSFSCTVSEILSLTSQNVKRSRDSQHMPFVGSISCVHEYSSASISKRNLSTYRFNDFQDMIGEKILKRVK